MGSGKSSVGKNLARKTGWLFSDTDTMVEAYSRRTIPEIFSTDGEGEFRRIEAEMVALAMKDPKPGIIATGGGAVLSKTSRELMKAKGYMVYLKASPADLLKRLRRDGTRPLLDEKDPLAVLERLLSERGKFYQEAHLEVEVSSRPVHSISATIWKTYSATHPVDIP